MYLMTSSWFVSKVREVCIQTFLIHVVVTNTQTKENTKMINNGGGRGIDQYERVWGQLFKTELPTVSTGTISLTSTDFPVESTRGTNTVASILRSSFLLRWSCIFLFLVPMSSSMSIFLGFESSPTGASTTAKSEGSSAKPEMN